LKSNNFLGFGELYILGLRSKTSYIVAAAAYPFAKFYMHGPA